MRERRRWEAIWVEFIMLQSRYCNAEVPQMQELGLISCRTAEELKIEGRANANKTGLHVMIHRCWTCGRSDGCLISAQKLVEAEKCATYVGAEASVSITERLFKLSYLT